MTGITQLPNLGNLFNTVNAACVNFNEFISENVYSIKLTENAIFCYFVSVISTKNYHN